MRTRRFYKYLMAMIIALGTSVNAMAQTQTRYLKVYFNQYTQGTTGAPEVLLKGDVPYNVSVTSEGVVWATSHRLFEGWHGDNEDRLIADFKGANKKESYLKLNFGSFPFEVNNIQWNRMNDLFSGSITQFFRIYEINSICTPTEGTASEDVTSYWDLNLLQKETGFTKKTVPAASGKTFNGLKSLEIGEKNYSIKWEKFFGIPYPVIPFQKDQQVELDENNRTFIKAGWNGDTENPKVINNSGRLINIASDDNYWAFKVKYTLPDIRMRCYYYDKVNKTIGQPDNNIFLGEEPGTHKLQGYITAHPGAVKVTTDIDAFHYEYEADANKIIIRPTSGVIEQVKVAGDIPVTVKLMRGEELVCSYPQTIHVYTHDTTRPEICIGYRNGQKGFDITYGSSNNWIEGYIAKYGTDEAGHDIVINPTEDINGYHFVYSESSNGQIIKIDSITGQITVKKGKEGDVEVSAVLKNGTEIASNTYTYTLHVFAQKEGLTWSRPYTYTNSTDGNLNSWKANTSGSTSYDYDWKQPIKNLDDGQRIPYLNVNTSILENSNYQSGAGSDNWKQIAWFKTTSDNHWRAVCQRISFKMLVPKYSKADGTFAFAGNVSIGSTNNGDCSYGFEIKDLTPSNVATTGITWNTKDAGEDISSSSGSNSTTTIARKGVDTYTKYVGDGMSNFTWSYDNSTGSSSADQTRYLAVMAYLYGDHSYPGEFSVGYKGIPTYEYYSTITYYKNDGTNNVWSGNGWNGTEPFTSTSKTETMQMYNGICPLPTLAGYEFLGWSTDPNATTAEYQGKGDSFCPYDAKNGGGKGPVKLYAVWSKIPDIVTLDPQGGTGGTTFVTATYGQPMPTITVPTRPGYEFYGYFAEQPEYNDDWLNGGTRYYNSDGTSAKNWDKNSDVTLYAHWKSAKYIVTFDINGGIMQENTGYQSDPSMSKLEEITDQLIKISFTYGHGGSDDIYNAKPKMGGFKCIGFYDDDNVLVASINSNPSNYNITINKNNKYWSGGNWNWPHDVTFTARYEPKFTYEDNVLDFGTEYLEIGKDWSQGVIHDVVDAAKYLMTKGRVSADNPVMVVNLNNANYLRGDRDGEFLKEAINSQPCFSPNLLVYLNGFYNRQENQIEAGNCSNLVVTDRFPIKIPYAFTASEASYARDAKVADDEKGKDQAKNSYWGTLCLPYPIKNNASGVKFYWLESTANNYMEFEEFGDNAIIPANTPVLYCRTDGGVGSMITIEEQSVGVPKNDTYTPVMIKYSDPQPGTYPLESASMTLQDWEFRGNLKTNVFCGKGYINPPAEAIANSDITDNGEVYYFKQNKFTRLTPLMTKNGTVYQAGKMILYPYRAYFYQKGDNSISAKVSDYSILVVGEDGSTTDITNAIFGEGEGDGKIYDLNGIRVMQPVKGRLYIVDGQKKVYR